MNKYKNRLKTSLLMLFATSSIMFSSCSEWLNVKPSNQVSAEDQFSKEDGFKTALSGVYTIMTKPALYGREMTFGVMDYLAQYWIAPDQYGIYYPVYKFEFDKTYSQSLVDPIWKEQYNAIANVNDLLAFVDVNKNVFTSEMSHSVIKGEALALRAYLHFDMLRAFAPYNFKGEESSTEKWLPYVDEYSRSTKESRTNKDFVNRVIADLEQALELLKLDPIYTGVTSNDTYFVNRNLHLNYYAVRALMARVYMYTGDNDNAAKAAEDVIAAQKAKNLFPWITVDEVTKTSIEDRDRTFSTEHIFALNVRNMSDNTKGFFHEATSTQLKLAKKSAPTFENQDEYRSKFVDVNDLPTKFEQPEKATNLTVTKYLRRMPMIRISEMYYIMAECSGDITYLNDVRANRGIIQELPATASLTAELLKEYEKEFIGEGQFFFYNKRINASRINNQKIVSYVLVMPENEINFGGRPRPKL